MTLFPRCKNCDEYLVRLYRYQTQSELRQEHLAKPNRLWKKMVKIENGFYCLNCKMSFKIELIKNDWENVPACGMDIGVNFD